MVRVPTPRLFKGQLYLLQDVISSGSSVFFPKFGSLDLGLKILEGVDIVFLHLPTLAKIALFPATMSEDSTRKVGRGNLHLGPNVVVIRKFKTTMTAEKNIVYHLSNKTILNCWLAKHFHL